MASLDLYFDEHASNDIDPLFKALYMLQRLPGCEKEAESIAKKLAEEFRHSPVKKQGQSIYRNSDGIRYHSNGIVELVANGVPKRTCVIEPWQVDNKSNEQVKEVANRPASYAPIKWINPIWHVQVMLHKKRKLSLKKDQKIQYQKVAEQFEVYKELDEDAQKLIEVDSMIASMENEAHKLHQLFTLDLRYFDEHRKNAVDPSIINSLATSFFFLTEAECEALCEAAEKDYVTYSKDFYYHYEIENIVKTVQLILIKPSKNRVYLSIPTNNEIMYNVQKIGKQWDDSEYSYTERHIHYEKVWNHYEKEFENLNEQHRLLLKRYGINIEPLEEKEK